MKPPRLKCVCYATVIRRTRVLEVPGEAGFRLGERVYLLVADDGVRITRRPALWPDCRYRTARIRRVSRYRFLKRL